MARGDRVRALAAAAVVAATLLAACAPAIASPGARRLSGPRGERVTIIRDDYGVPHVYARDAAGAEFGFGYALAQDQGPFVLQQYRIAMGRDAETFGPSCLPGCLNSDRLVYLFRVPQTAQAAYPQLPAGDRRRFQAFADGINAYVDTHRSSLPSWVADVAPQDVFAYSQYPLFAGQISRALQKVPGSGGAARAAAAGAPQAVPSQASNMFVLGPSKTRRHRPIVYGDPHLPWTGMQQWYEAQLNYGRTSIAGATWRGWPFIGIGTNRHVAWSATNNPVDEADVYRETLDPANPNRYLFGGSYRTMTTETVGIKVRTASGLQTQPQTLRYTVHGPVLDGVGPRPPAGSAYSVTASLFEQTGLAHEAWRLDQARNLAQLERAASAVQIPTFNLMGADAKGDIFYVANTRTGRRNTGFDYNAPLPGSDPRSAWQGIVPFSDLPQAVNGSRGYYMNANNNPVYSAPGQISTAFPGYLLTGGYSLRPYRLDQLLGPLQGVTGPEAGRIGHDIRVPAADGLKPILAEAVRRAGPRADPTGDLARAVQILDGWEDVASQDSEQMELFTVWYHEYFAQHPSGAGLRPPPALQPTPADLFKAIAGLQQAVRYMRATYGSLTVRWGDVHKVARGQVVLPVDGGTTEEDMVHPTNPVTTINGVGFAGQGSSYMWWYDFATRRMFRTRPVGETDDPSSPHYADMTRAYSADRFLPFWLSRRDVLRHRESTTRLRAPVG